VEDSREESVGCERLVEIDRFLPAYAIYEADNHKEVADDKTEGRLISVRYEVGCAWGCEVRNMLTLTCANMIVVPPWKLMSIILWGIVTAVIKSDAPNADNINIFLLRESPMSLQSSSGAATRTTSAMTSAAGTHEVRTIKVQRYTD
jgi:hypothetical protein